MPAYIHVMLFSASHAGSIDFVFYCGGVSLIPESHDTATGKSMELVDLGRGHDRKTGKSSSMMQWRLSIAV